MLINKHVSCNVSNIKLNGIIGTNIDPGIIEPIVNAVLCFTQNCLNLFIIIF